MSSSWITDYLNARVPKEPTLDRGPLTGYHWQLARILRDTQYPHLRGCIIWVTLGKPLLYPISGRRRVRLVSSNLLEDYTLTDGQGNAGFYPKNVERLAHLVSDHFFPFAASVPTVHKRTWSNPNWQGMFPDYALPYLPVTRWGKSPATMKSQRGAGTRLAKGHRKHVKEPKGGTTHP